MLPEAQVVHRIAGRTRLRISGKRNDMIYFSRLAESIMNCPGVEQASVNPITGSLIVRHAVSFEEVVSYAQAQQLFQLTDSPPATRLRARVAQGLEETSRNLEKVSGGEVDLDGLLIMGLTGLAIHQAIEGNIMAPAVTLIWYALSAARETK